jgi:23S rRNA (uracil1939-C5)-methyltransferase
MQGPVWGYRYRARLSVRHVRKKNAVLVGFHERKSSYVADITQCHVLPPQVSALLLPLRELIGAMQARETCPQIELAMGDAEGGGVIALVLRHLEPLCASDIGLLRAFAKTHPGVQWWLQPGGPQTAHWLDEGGAPLAYTLPEFGITMPFRPTDFTQVNPHINRILVGRALRLLDAQEHERVIDWFCGLGNFTLPLATRAGAVLGIEGSPVLIERSRQNYQSNQAVALDGKRLSDIEFVARNLFEMTPSQLMADGAADKWMIDPPREGAFALVKALADLRQHLELCSGAALARGSGHEGGWTPPRRIVYVSCNPATLARDAGVLVHLAGYRCAAAGVVNMFPHTAHVESIAVFELA